MLSRRIGRPADSRAQAFIEFALVLPFLMVMLAAILDFGFWLYDIIGTHAALRAGALAAVQSRADGTPLYTDDQIRNVIVEAHGPVLAIEPPEVTVSRQDADPGFGGNRPSVTVTIRHQHNFVCPVYMPVGPQVMIQSAVRAPVMVTQAR